MTTAENGPLKSRSIAHLDCCCCCWNLFYKGGPFSTGLLNSYFSGKGLKIFLIYLNVLLFSRNTFFPLHPLPKKRFFLGEKRKEEEKKTDTTNNNTTQQQAKTSNVGKRTSPLSLDAISFSSGDCTRAFCIPCDTITYI